MKRQKLKMVKYRSICEITVKKVLDKRGESIAEVLIALLISALALTILASMITSTKNVLETSKRKMNDYNSHAAVLAEQSSGSNTGTGTVKMTVSGAGVTTTTWNMTGDTSTASVKYYVNPEFSGTPVVAYAP